MDSPAPVGSGAPLLEGQDAARATAALRGIVEWLRARPADPGAATGAGAASATAAPGVAPSAVTAAATPGEAVRDDRTLATVVRAASLAEGDAGLAVFFAALARSGFDADAGRDAEHHATRAAEAVGTLVMTDSFFSGFPGVVWALHRVAGGAGLAARAPGVEAGPDPYDTIDGVLAEHLGRAPWVGDFDLVNGLVGLAAYALERLPAPGARAGLEHAVARLDEMAERTADGPTWRTPPDRLDAERRDGRTQGPFNLGVAHGVPGVLGALAATIEAGVARERAMRLLDGGVGWLLARRMPDRAESCFAHSAGPGAPDAPSRLAWCYGDLGIAAVLHRAARAVRRPDWDAAAGEIARRAARRSGEQGGVRDAGVCHGAAGIAHLFHRLGRERGDAALLEAARRWCRDLLDRRDPSLGAAGFPAWTLSGATGGTWTEDPGLLTGAAGVGLVLLGTLAPGFMEWDRMLLVSTRARSRRP